MSNQAPHETQQVPSEMVLDTLDREGDVILAAGEYSTNQRRFLVSSKVLSLASPVFAALFGPQFLEGCRMAEHGPITIRLNEDDAKAMGIILGVIHHQAAPEIEKLTAKEMAILAILCDKYDCVRVIQPWTSKWFLRHQGFLYLKDYGLILTAAHFLRASDEFFTISRQAILGLTKPSVDRWEDTDISNLLPQRIRRDINDEIGTLQYEIHKEVQFVEVELRAMKSVYSTKEAMCKSCGNLSRDCKKSSHSCRIAALYPIMCTVDYRISEYFAMLGRVALWPSATTYRDWSVSTLASYIQQGKNGLPLKHICKNGDRCDLIMCVGKLCAKVDNMVNNVRGMSLYPLSG